MRLPVTISQDLPPYPGMVPPAGLRGVVEVLINESGRVELAAMVVPVQPHVDSGARSLAAATSYQKMVLTAASRWRFEPAMMNGTPVQFRKRVQIHIAPPPTR